MTMVESEHETLVSLIGEKLKHFKRGQVAWSFLYNGALYMAPVGAFLTTLSASTGGSKATSTFAGGVTTLLTAVAAQGRFQDKWRANRLARSGLEQLQVDLMEPNADLHAVREQFKQIVREEDRAILGPTAEA